MFAAEVYRQRRERLALEMGTGVILFLGNTQSPINFLDNVYPFRQDSSFLYFWGLENSCLTAVIDVDASSETIFGDDMTLEESVWAGSQPSLVSLCEKAGIRKVAPADHLEGVISQARKSGRKVHFLPDSEQQYSQIVPPAGHQPRGCGRKFAAMIRAVVAQRSIKSDAEIEEIKNCHRYVVPHADPGHENSISGHA